MSDIKLKRQPLIGLTNVTHFRVRCHRHDGNLNSDRDFVKLDDFSIKYESKTIANTYIMRNLKVIFLSQS